MQPLAKANPLKGAASTAASLKQQLLAAYRQRTSAAYCAHAPEPYAALASRGDWSTELWDVCSQPGGINMCCLSLWCPCIQYGMLLEQLPPGSVTCAGSLAGSCALFGVLWLLGDVLGAALLTKVFTLPCTALVHAQTRGHIRSKYGIQSHPLHDFFITWCCAPCALCQEARETVIRQAAEREDLSARPVHSSRPGSVHGGAYAMSSAGKVSPLMSPMGSQLEHTGLEGGPFAGGLAAHMGNGNGHGAVLSPAVVHATGIPVHAAWVAGAASHLRDSNGSLGPAASGAVVAVAPPQLPPLPSPAAESRPVHATATATIMPSAASPVSTITPRNSGGGARPAALTAEGATTVTLRAYASPLRKAAASKPE